jgi:amiloride-sensitive sodium channel
MNSTLVIKSLIVLQVTVHNPMDIPRPSKSYFRVPYDKEVLVAVQPELILTSKEVQNFDVEKRNCYLKSERFLHYFKIYTQSNCVLECFTNYTLKNCGCVEFFMPSEFITHKFIKHLPNVKC